MTCSHYPARLDDIVLPFTVGGGLRRQVLARPDAPALVEAGAAGQPARRWIQNFILRDRFVAGDFDAAATRA